jgi:hypothetical protein
MQMFNPFVAISFQAARLGWETQNLMALRLMRLAGGGLAGQSEAHPINTEKMAALTKAKTAGTAVAVEGRNGGDVASKKVTRVHKKRGGGNKRRLSK